MSNSLPPHGLQPTGLLCPWNSPGKNTGVSWHFLLQGSFVTQGLNLRLLHLLQGRWILYPLSQLGSPSPSSHFKIPVSSPCRRSVDSQETFLALNAPPIDFVGFRNHLSILGVPFLLNQMQTFLTFHETTQNEKENLQLRHLVNVSVSIKIDRNRDLLKSNKFFKWLLENLVF